MAILMKNKTKKIERVFVKDEAYNILEENIVSGKLKPNTRLKINELSENLGISRTPIREAILRLENEGLVMSKANQWTIVAPIFIDSIKNIYPLVYDLEAFCLKDGFDRIDDSFIETLKSINEEIKEYNENKLQIEVITLDNDFHDHIIALSKNTEVKPILDNLKKKIKRLEIIFYTSKNADELTSTYLEHADLIKALEERNLEKSLDCLKVNWANVLDKKSLAGLRNSDEYRDFFA